MKHEKDLTKLTPLQFKVTQEAATERAFQNEYWDHHEEGIYVDITDGTPLFSSLDKFDSGCGWPSFSKPIGNKVVRQKLDFSFGMIREEVRSLDSNAHLGHVFNDGPLSLGGRRYCINSASLKFIPRNTLEQEGYGEFLSLFDKKK